MKRVRVIEDWSRFNDAVLRVADGVPKPAPRPSPAPPAPQEPSELVSEPAGVSDAYGLITRHRWRKHA